MVTFGAQVGGRWSSARTAAGWRCRGPPTSGQALEPALGAHPRAGIHVARPAGSAGGRSPTCRSVATRATSLRVCRGRRTWVRSQIRGAALVWDLHSGAAPRRFRFIGEVVPQVALDERGEVLFTSHPLTRRSVVTGASRVLVRARLVLVPRVLPDGDVLGIDDNTPTRVDGSSGEVLASYPSDGSFLMSLRVRPDGRRFMVISSDEREVREWKVVDANGASRNLLPRPRQRQRRRLLRRRDVRLCVGTGWHRPAPLGPHRREGLRVDRADVLRLERPVRGDGRRRPALRGAGRRRMGPVRLPHGQGRRDIPGPGASGTRYGAFHPDGRHFATAAGPGSRCGTATASRPASRRCSPPRQITELDYTPDGSRLAVAELDGTITLLDGDSLERVGTPVEMGEPVSWVVARPDGRTAVVLLGGVGRLRQLRAPEPAAGRWSTWSTGSCVRRGSWR